MGKGVCLGSQGRGPFTWRSWRYLVHTSAPRPHMTRSGHVQCRVLTGVVSAPGGTFAHHACLCDAVNCCGFGSKVGYCCSQRPNSCHRIPGVSPCAAARFSSQNTLPGSGRLASYERRGGRGPVTGVVGAARSSTTSCQWSGIHPPQGPSSLHSQ